MADELSLIRSKGKMTGWVAAFLVLGGPYQIIPPVNGHLEPLSNKVSLTLVTERSNYYVGEPVGLRLTVLNFSDTVVVGAFALEPSAGKAVPLCQQCVRQVTLGV